MSDLGPDETAKMQTVYTKEGLGHFSKEAKPCALLKCR